MKVFNTAAVCIPSKHYMVDLSDKVAAIKKLVDGGKYFTINRARQYGKTTVLYALQSCLRDEYEVVSLDFQSLSYASFETEESFCRGFVKLILEENVYSQIELSAENYELLNSFAQPEKNENKIEDLLRVIRTWCKNSQKPIVLMIDEVDSATNNQVFLDFLAALRDGYIKRDTKGIPTFRSVVLVGVTDVRQLKRKIRMDASQKENSPWNIAADFDVDLSLSEAGIGRMLEEYERDHHYGLDCAALAAYLEDFTAGYPYLVSRICELIDTKLVPSKFATAPEAWTVSGVDEAIKMILADGDNPLFGSLMGKLENYPKLKDQLRAILMRGDTIPWKPDDDEQQQLRMYGLISVNGNVIEIANRIFEMRLYQYFLGETGKNDAFRKAALISKSIFINDDQTLNMPLILDHFVKAQHRIHKGEEEHFLEEEGRERFLTYISPIINGTGSYSIEEQTRDALRMDVVIHYLGKEYIVELKIWRGQRYHEAGEKQIMEYLDRFDLNTGYMVSFCFNHNKTPGVERVKIGNKLLFEALL